MHAHACAGSGLGYTAGRGHIVVKKRWCSCVAQDSHGLVCFFRSQPPPRSSLSSSAAAVPPLGAVSYVAATLTGGGGGGGCAIELLMPSGGVEVLRLPSPAEAEAAVKVLKQALPTAQQGSAIAAVRGRRVLGPAQQRQPQQEDGRRPCSRRRWRARRGSKSALLLLLPSRPRGRQQQLLRQRQRQRQHQRRRRPRRRARHRHRRRRP